MIFNTVYGSGGSSEPTVHKEYLSLNANGSVSLSANNEGTYSTGNTVKLSHTCNEMLKCVFDAWQTSGFSIDVTFSEFGSSSKTEAWASISRGISSGSTANAATPPENGYTGIYTIFDYVQLKDYNSTYYRGSASMRIGLSKQYVAWQMTFGFSLVSIGATARCTLGLSNPIKFTIQYY